MMGYIKNRLFQILFIGIIILFTGYGYYADAYQNHKQHLAPVTVRSITNDLLKKIKSGQYKEVEEYFDYLVNERPYSRNGSRLLEEIYDDFQCRRYILKYLDKWCSQTTHHSAYIARGRFLIGHAWRARGGGWGYTVSKEGKRLMRERLYLAKKDLENAYKLNTLDPNSASEMIWVCIGLGLDEVIMEKWFHRAINADPFSSRSYLNKLIYLTPKWHGSSEKFRKFAEYCYNNSPPGSSVYTFMIDYLYECAERSNDKKAFLSNQVVQKILDDVFKRWFTDFPETTAGRIWMARINEDYGNNEEAIKYCNEVLKMEPDHICALSKRGDIYFNTEEYKIAEKDFKKLLKIDPHSDYALQTLGKIQMYHYKNYSNAIEYFSKAISLDPKEQKYFYLRGQAKSRLKDYKSAITDFTAAIKIDYRFKDAYYERGNAEYYLQNYESAIKDCSKAIQIDPKLGRAYYKRGLCLWRLNELEKCKEDFYKAKLYDPGYASSVDRHLKALQSESSKTTVTKADRHQNKAEKRYSKSATISTHKAKTSKPKIASNHARSKRESPEIKSLRSRGKTHYAQRKVEDAKNDFKKILELDPQNDNAFYMLGRIASYPTKDYKKAIKYYDMAISLNSINKKYFYHRGMASYFLNDYESAIEDFTSAIQLDPKFGKAYYFRGRCLWRLNELEKCKEDYLKAKLYNPSHASAVDRHLMEMKK